MPRRYTDEQVEEMMVPRIVDAIYPLLIPIEPQDCAIQERNRTKITEIARQAWRSFQGRH